MEILIRLLPPNAISTDRLNVYNDELKEIKNELCDFSGKLSIFCIKYAAVDQMPRSHTYEPMTVQWWQDQKELLLQKAVQHERDVRHAANQLREQIQAGISNSQEEYCSNQV